MLGISLSSITSAWPLRPENFILIQKKKFGLVINYMRTG